MASYRDLLDAIARVGATTRNPEAWKDGLTGADVAVACNPMSPPVAVEAVLAKLTAAHPEVFASRPADGPSVPTGGAGATADAICTAEAVLSRQRSDAAHLDLQVLTALVNAHSTAVEGLTQLSALQREIEAAVASRTDLDTPAGARQLQRFLIGKIRDIRSVVESAGLDSQSKAMLADALSALYAASAPEAVDRATLGSVESPSTTTAAGPEPAVGAVRDAGPATSSSMGRDDATTALPDYLESGPLPDYLAGTPLPDYLATDAPAAAPAPAPVMSPAASPAMPVLPPFGGMMPAGAPFGGLGTPMGGGLSSAPFGPQAMSEAAWPDLSPAGLAAPDHLGDEHRHTEASLSVSDPTATDETATDPVVEDRGLADEAETAAGPETAPTPVLLPDGETCLAPSPLLASVITAAVSGAPIPTAFGWQGISIPTPGSPVTAPVDPARLLPGDIAVLADRHALALGNGRVLLDNEIQPTSSVLGPGFIGWQHPPQPDPANSPPASTAPDRSAATAPS